MWARALAVSLVVALAACGSADTSTTPAGSAAPASTTASAGEDWLSPATNQLGFDLLEQLADGENVVVSPLSVAIVLGMLLHGANGSTADALAAALHADGRDEDAVNESIVAVLELLRTTDEVEIGVASSVWADDSMPILPTYRERVTSTFDAAVEATDLGSPGAASAIDAWVRAATGEELDGIATDLGVPDPALLVVLVNAVHFVGTWTTSFDPDRTADAPFTLANGTAISVPMMRRTGDVARARGDGFEVARLPYGAGSRFALDVVLPDGPIAELDLTVDELADAIAVLETRPTELALPRLDVEYTTPGRRLDEALGRLGLGVLYGAEADFSRLSDAAPALSRVVHKTRIRLHETGTSAAAATAAGMRSVPDPLVVDRPFLFAITDTVTGTALFVGALVDPGD